MYYQVYYANRQITYKYNAVTLANEHEKCVATPTKFELCTNMYTLLQIGLNPRNAISILAARRHTHTHNIIQCQAPFKMLHTEYH